MTIARNAGLNDREISERLSLHATRPEEAGTRVLRPCLEADQNQDHQQQPHPDEARSAASKDVPLARNMPPIFRGGSDGRLQSAAVRAVRRLKGLGMVTLLKARIQAPQLNYRKASL